MSGMVGEGVNVIVQGAVGHGCCRWGGGVGQKARHGQVLGSWHNKGMWAGKVCSGECVGKANKSKAIGSRHARYGAKANRTQLLGEGGQGPKGGVYTHNNRIQQNKGRGQGALVGMGK